MSTSDRSARLASRIDAAIVQIESQAKSEQELKDQAARDLKDVAASLSKIWHQLDLPDVAPLWLAAARGGWEKRILKGKHKLLSSNSRASVEEIDTMPCLVLDLDAIVLSEEGDIYHVLAPGAYVPLQDFEPSHDELVNFAEMPHETFAQSNYQRYCHSVLANQLIDRAADVRPVLERVLAVAETEMERLEQKLATVANLNGADTAERAQSFSRRARRATSL